MSSRKTRHERERTNKDYHDARTTNIIANEVKTRGFRGSLHSLPIFPAEDLLFDFTKYYENVFFSSRNNTYFSRTSNYQVVEEKQLSRNDNIAFEKEKFLHGYKSRSIFFLKCYREDRRSQ